MTVTTLPNAADRAVAAGPALNLDVIDWEPLCGWPRCERRARWVMACPRCGALAPAGACRWHRWIVGRQIKARARILFVEFGITTHCRACRALLPPISWRAL